MGNMGAITPIRMRTNENTKSLGYLRLMQLVSPSLPIGGFTYSQGLEYAVECAWVRDTTTLKDWISGLLGSGVTYLDLPILKRIYVAIQSSDMERLNYWSHFLLASRESRELRSEEINRAKALSALLPNLGINYLEGMNEAMETTQLSPFAFASVSWNVSLHDTALGFAWSWLENQVAAAIKLVPLGQTQGQQVQLMMATKIPHAVDLGLSLKDYEIGASAPALSIASARHETQYTRLFRS